jgi:hypothetical protein
MKKTLLAALAIAGFAVASNAQAQSTYTTGNSFLFFRSTAGSGASNSLLINLGSIGVAGNDYNGTRYFSSINLDLSASDSIVSQTYGTNWWNNQNLRWGVIGSVQDNNANTDTFSYRLSGTIAPLSLSMEGRVALANQIDNASVYAFSMPISTTGLINGTYRYGVTANGYVLIETSVDGVAQDSYINYNEGMDIAAFDRGGFGGVMSTLSKDITLVSSQNLYAANNTVDRVAGEVTSAGSPVQFGTVSVANGVVSVVPEPATYALFGFGALLLIVAYRRANA